jgi:Flp pilus assembly protein TadG
MAYRHFISDSRGGVAPLLALSMIPIIATVGAAVDYSRANSIKASMQAALDSTGLALARQAASGTQISASNYFSGNFVRPEVTNLEVTSASSAVPGGTMLSLSATGRINTQLMGLLGFTALTVTTTSSVVAVADGLGCVLSLNKSASGAITGQGSTTVELKGCSLYDNSANATALTVGGSAKISALSVGVVGGISGGSGLLADQGIRTGIGPVPDPYANANYPSFSGCTENNFKAKESTTISPGVYCGGISINAGVELSLNPGIYYLDGGDLSVNGGASLAGAGVTLVFTRQSHGTFATAAINGNAKVYLTAPKSGPTAGIVMFGDRTMPVGTEFKLNGGSTQYLGGAIYLPNGAINYSGNAATSTNCTQIIGDTITFTGNSGVAINCSSYETKPFSAWTVRLAS